VLWNVPVWGTAALLLVLYLHGRRRLSAIAPSLAGPVRLACIAAALAAWAAALAFPLDQLSRSNVFARMGQAVLVCLVAGPLFWQALPWHGLTAALPHRLRNRLTGLALRPSRFSPLLGAATSSIFVWFFYLSAILIWHDPGYVEWEMASPLRQHASLLLLTTAALLFWQQITRAGPRRYTRATYVGRVVMLLGVEIPNVIAGMSIAFRTAPLYAWYTVQPGAEPLMLQQALAQQSLSGALTWVFGSLVYITSIVLVVNEAFAREGFRRDPPAYWDSEERFIAPGLESRLNELEYQPHDWDKM